MTEAISQVFPEAEVRLVEYTDKMSKTIIPAGFRVTIVSWENDADSFRTKIKEGLSESKTRYFVDLASMFTRENCHRGLDIANLYEPSPHELERVYAAFRAFAKKHPNEFVYDDDFDIENDDHLNDVIGDHLYEVGLSGDEFFTRVTDSIKVEYIAAAIELQDVTKDFVK
jgi:hypothetical protein